MRATATVLERASDGVGIRLEEEPRCRLSPVAYRLSSGAVVGDILLERIEFLGKIVNTPLQEIANREHAQQLALIIDDGQMAEMALDHGGHGFARPGSQCGHFHWSC